MSLLLSLHSSSDPHLWAHPACFSAWLRQNGDIYLIRERDVRRFVLEHPSEIDLRNVDQLWFLDRLTNGLARTA